ncbi:MAG: FHA domain-containing protein [Deltaproteobacteria bacterium]|nr:FHA domain-containing protein [Deltaproteobacteria bacterium]
MSSSDTTETTPGQSQAFMGRALLPGIFVAFAPFGSTTVDRCLVADPFVVGRGAGCDLTIRDDKVSKKHFRITRGADGFWIEDLKSTNGTFVNGAPLVTQNKLQSPAVIRVGRAVLVFYNDAAPLLEPPPPNRFGMGGDFHTGPIIEALSDAARSNRHVLLSGSSGTGKELAAKAYASMIGRGTFLTHNAARFASAEEAATTLFGVGPKVFSGVEERPGLIERAYQGLLFLDEVHNLPGRVQRSLLRVIEDGETARIGETVTRPADVRFVLASNVQDGTRGLAHDLYTRLREVRIQPISERVADIPSIFNGVLRAALGQFNLDDAPVIDLLSGDHYESLCLDGFLADNVRGLVDLADRVATRIRGGTDPARSLELVFGDRFADGPVPSRYRGSEEAGALHYEQNKEYIVAAYRECNGNISAVERALKTKGLRCSRRWLTVYLGKWGVR